MKQRKIALFLSLLLIISLTGCKLYDVPEQNYNATSNDTATETDAATDTQPTEAVDAKEPEASATESLENTAEESVSEEETETTEEDMAKESVTPYQFLNLLLGNADQLTISYQILQENDQRLDQATFYKQNDLTSVIFTTYGMDLEEQTVQEIEKDGYVYYYMHDHDKVISYLAPANDIFIYTLMHVLSTDEISATSDQDTFIYEYSVPYALDESINFGYLFYMVNNTLTKVTVSVNGELSQTYTFNAFLTDSVDPSVFEFPSDLPITSYDYQFADDALVPWWE